MIWKKYNLPVLLAIFVLLVLFIGTPLLAQGDESDEGEDNDQVADTVDAEDDVDADMDDEEPDEPDVPLRDPKVPTYLDGIDASEGELAIVFKFDDSGTDSAFHGRYEDPFEGDFGFLDNLMYRGVSGGSVFEFGASHTWDPSWRAHFEWNKPGVFRFWANNNEYANFQIPSGFAATRHDANFGLEWLGSDNFSMAFDYSQHENKFGSDERWASDDWSIDTGLTFGSWDTSFTFRQTLFDDKTGPGFDVEYNTTSILVGKDCGDDAWLGGSFVYTYSDVENRTKLDSLKYGLEARFRNTLGIDRFSVNTGFDLEDRNEGPSRLHPEDDEFNFDLDANWRGDAVSLYGAWNHNTAAAAHADHYTNWNLIHDPMDADTLFGWTYNDEIITNTWNVGGSWTFMEDLTIGYDYLWKGREGLPPTEWVDPASPSLFWETDVSSNFTLRYDPNGGIGTSDGIMVLKFETQEKDNKDRFSDSYTEHLSVNWTGSVTDTIWVYAGGGYFNSENNIPGIYTAEILEGTEYGFGWSWMASDDLDWYGDYWTYDVTGTTDFDQTNFSTGIGYEAGENWLWNVDYNAVDGSFEDMSSFDFDVTEFLLKLTYLW